MTAAPQAWVSVRVSPRGTVSRRTFLRAAAVGTAGLGWRGSLAAHADELKKQNRACILLWMAGGPSQFESFDPKPDSPNQGPTKTIASAVPGLRVAEHWPKMASALAEMAVIRSMTSAEGNHGRATYLLHTSYPPSGGIVHPGFGSLVAQLIGEPGFDLPLVVSISGQTMGPSFLGVKFAPFVVTDPTKP